MKRLVQKLTPSSHPQHCILGIVEILVGLILICNDYYFFYPPQFAMALNDDLIGGCAVYYGVRTIIWALQDNNIIKVNRNLLFFSAFFWGFELTAEFVQGCKSGSPTRFMICALALGLLLMTFSIIEKSPKSKYSHKS